MLFGPSWAWLVALLWVSLAASVFAAPQAVSSPGNSSVTPTGTPTTSASTPANSPSTVLSPNPSIESSPSSASPSTPARATSTSPAAPPVQASHTSEVQSSSEEPSRPTTTSSASTHSDPAPPASAPAQGGQGSSSTPDRNTASSSPSPPTTRAPQGGSSDPTTSHNDSASPSSEHGASPSTSPTRAPQGGSGQTSTSLSPAPPDTSTRTTSPTSVTRATQGGSGDSTTTTRSPSSDPPGTSTGRAGQDTTTQGGSGPGTTSTTNQPPSTSPSRAPGQGGTSTRSSSDGGATSETSRGSTTSHTSPGHPGQGGTSTTSHSSVSTSATGRDQSTTTSRTSSDDPGQGRTSSSTSHSSASTSGSSDGSSATTTYTSPGHPGQGGTSTTSHSGGLTSTITSSASHSSPSHPGQGESSGSASSTSNRSGSTTSTEPHSHTSVSNPGQGATSRSSSGSGSGEPTSRSRSTDGASSTTSGNRTTTPTADPGSSPSGSDSSRSPSATESHRGSSVSPTTDNVTASGSSGSGNPSSSRSSRQPSETGGSSPSHAVSGSETAGSSRRPGGSNGPSGSGSPQQTRSTNPSETATGAGPHFTSLSDGRPDGLSSSPRSGAQRTISGTPTPTVRTSRPSDTSSPGALAYSTSLTDDSTSRRGGDGRTSIVSVTLVYTSTSPGGLVTTITTVVPTQTLIPNSLTGTKSLKHDPGAIAGIGIGSLAAILVLVLWIKFAMRTRRVQRLESDALASPRDESPGPLDNEIDSHPAPGGEMGERAVLPLAAAGGYGSVSRFRSRDGTLYASVDEDEPYSAGALSGHSPAAFEPFADPFDGSDEAGVSSSPRVMTEHIPGGPPPSAWLRGSFAPSGGVSRFPSGAVAEDPLILTGGASDPEVDEQFLSGLARVGAYASGSGSSEGHALAPSSMGHSPASALYSPDGALSRNRLSVPETRRQSSLGHGSSSESHSGEDNRAGRAVVGGLEGSARPTPSRTSSVRGLLSRGLNWRQPRPQSAVTVPTFFEPPPELVSRPGPRSSLPPTSPMVPMRPHTMSDSGHGSLVRANRPGFVPHWHDQGTFGPRMVTLESSSALPSPAATDATTRDGLLRLEGEAARSTADISLLDEVDYSRPIGGLVHNRTHSMTTFETQDTRRTVRTGQSNPETPLSVLQDPFRDLLDDGLGSEAGHTIGH